MDDRHATSLDRGLALFAAILADRGRTPLAQLPVLRDTPPATRYRLVAALVRAGLITRTERGHYDASAALAGAVEHLTPEAQIARGARPLLRRLARATGLTAHLGVLENDMVTYLVKAPGRAPHAGAAFTREGGQLEAYCSAIGKVLLAQASEDARGAYLAAGPFVALTDRTVTDPARIAADLARVRERGYGIDDREIAPDLFCLAVPVHTDSGHPLLAISVSMAHYPADDPARGATLAMLRRTADSIATGTRYGYDTLLIAER